MGTGQSNGKRGGGGVGDISIDLTNIATDTGSDLPGKRDLADFVGVKSWK